MAIRARRPILSNHTNLDVGPALAGKPGELKKVAVIKPLRSTATVTTVVTTTGHPLLQAAHGACKENDAGPQTKPIPAEQDKDIKDVPAKPVNLLPLHTPQTGDEFYCSSYAEDIYAYLMESEKRECYTIRPDFLDHQPRVNASNRRVLVDWLVKVHQKFDMQHETLFIAVDTLDRYLQVIHHTDCTCLQPA